MRSKSTTSKGRNSKVEGMRKRVGVRSLSLSIPYRANYDAAINKVERMKSSKKDKDKEEADVELDICKSK